MTGSKIPSMPQTDYSAFRRIDEVTAQVPDERFIMNKAARHLKRNGALAHLTERLEQCGFKRVSEKIRHGGEALVFEASGGQMLRVVHALKPINRQPINCLLKPIHTIQDGEFFIEVLPKVHTLHDIYASNELSKEYGIRTPQDCARHVREALINAAHDGYFFFDASPSNIAILTLPSGKHVSMVLESGALVKWKDVHSQHRSEFAGRVKHRLEWFDTFTKIFAGDSDAMTTGSLNAYRDYLEQQEPTPPHQFRAAQAAHLERLGLRESRMQGIYNDQQIAKLIDNFAQKRSSYEGAVDGETQQPYDARQSLHAQLRRSGVSRQELGDIAKAALQDDQTEGKGFCKRLRHEAVKRDILPDR